MKIVIISYRRPAGKNGKLGPISVVLFHKAENFSTFISNISDLNSAWKFVMCTLSSWNTLNGNLKKDLLNLLRSMLLLALQSSSTNLLCFFFSLFSRGEAVFVTHLSGCHKKTTPLWFQLLLKVHAFDIVRFVSVQRFEVFLDSPSTNPNERVFI